MEEPSQNQPTLFIKANTPDEYKVLCYFFECLLPPKTREEKFTFDPGTGKVTSYFTYTELWERLWRFSDQFYGSHILFEGYAFSIQLAENASAEEKQRYQQDIQRFVNNTLSSKFLSTLKKLPAEEVEKIKSTEKELLDCQVILVQDNHDTVDAKQWIIKHAKKIGECTLFVEFSYLDGTDYKKLSSMVWMGNLGASYAADKTCPKVQEMMDVVKAVGGEVIGGESQLSVELSVKRANRMSLAWTEERLTERHETTDAGFCEKIKARLEKDPNRKIVAWAGSAHAEGTMKNILKIFPEITIGIIYPGTDEPIYCVNRPVRAVRRLPLVSAVTELTPAEIAEARFREVQAYLLHQNAVCTAQREYKALIKNSIRVLGFGRYHLGLFRQVPKEIAEKIAGKIARYILSPIRTRIN